MIDILEGLRHLHTFPTPIAHGDLCPVSTESIGIFCLRMCLYSSLHFQSNILVDVNGTLKLTLFSLSRLAADMPRTEEPYSLIDFVETIRYFSPETLHLEARPSVWADMWAFGCVVFWVSFRFTFKHQRCGN